METRMQLPEFHRSRPNIGDKSVVFIPAARRHQRRGRGVGRGMKMLKLQRPQNSCMQRNQDCWPCFHDRMHPPHENACTHIGARGLRALSGPRVRVNPSLPSFTRNILFSLYSLLFFFFIIISQNISKSKLSFIFVSLFKRRYLGDRNFNFRNVFGIF